MQLRAGYKMSTEQIMSMLSGMILEAGGYIKAGKYEPLLGAQACVTHICEKLNWLLQ